MSARDFEVVVLPLVPQLRERARHFARGGADAEDLLQETLLRALRAWGQTDVQNVWGWLWLTMRNVFLDRRRKAACWRERVEAFAQDIADVRSDPPRAPDAGLEESTDDRLERVMACLTPAQRAIVDLQLAGIDDRSIAGLLRIDIKTVRTTSCKARHRMREAAATASK